MSTNSITPATSLFDSIPKWDANINNTLNIQITLKDKNSLQFCTFEKIKNQVPASRKRLKIYSCKTYNLTLPNIKNDS